MASHNEISSLAYDIWKNHGGDSQKNWAEAERILYNRREENRVDMQRAIEDALESQRMDEMIRNSDSWGY